MVNCDEKCLGGRPILKVSGWSAGERSLLNIVILVIFLYFKGIINVSFIPSFVIALLF